MVLQWFLEAGLKLKPSKCYFFDTQVTFLGPVLTPEGLLPDPDNVQRITVWPVPACVTDVWAILGMGNYYRQFIQNYSKKVQPLIKLTKKDKSWVDRRVSECFWSVEGSINRSWYHGLPNGCGWIYPGHWCQPRHSGSSPVPGSRWGWACYSIWQ